jgi:2',3'-cyclic-nucleotide 2'-phosphodiesterase (5'-nucleotidase family)
VLVVDSGNALYRVIGVDDAMAVKRADFIMAKMGQLGTFAMAVGARELNVGPAALKAAAEKSKVKLLAANLVGADGKPLFPGSAVITVGAVKVGLIGVSPPGPYPGVKGVQGLPVVAAVAREAKALKGKVDLVVLLAAVPYADALQLSTEVGDAVDLILNSHDGRGASPAQRNEKNYLLSSGERGRQVGRLDLELTGRGLFADLDEATREAQLVPMLQSQVDQLRKRLDVTKDEKARADLKASIESLELSKKSHAKNAAPDPKGARTLKLTWVSLGPEVKDEPALKDEVDKLEAVPPR